MGSTPAYTELKIVWVEVCQIFLPGCCLAKHTQRLFRSSWYHSIACKRQYLVSVQRYFKQILIFPYTWWITGIPLTIQIHFKVQSYDPLSSSHLLLPSLPPLQEASVIFHCEKSDLHIKHALSLALCLPPSPSPSPSLPLCRLRGEENLQCFFLSVPTGRKGVN